MKFLAFNITVAMYIVLVSNGAAAGKRSRYLGTLNNPDKRMTKQDDRWEVCLIASPGVINLLGELMLLSSRVDFSLAHESATPIGGYKYMRHPSSFRATLVQISNDAWQSFEGAHSNMHKIQLNMKNIPRYLINILKVIESRNEEALTKMLPILLNQIQTAAKRSAMAARDTHAEFNGVMNLLAEVLEVTQDSNKVYSDQLHEIKVELEVSNVFIKKLDDILENQEAYLADQKKRVLDLQSQYKSALDEIPTGWDAVFQDVVREVGRMVSMKWINSNSQNNRYANGGQQSTEAQENFANQMTCKALSPILMKLDEVRKYAGAAMRGDLTAFTGEPTALFRGFNVGFATMAGFVEKSAVAQQIADLMNKMTEANDKCINLLEKVISNKASFNPENETLIPEIKQLYQQFEDGISPIVTKSCAASGTVPFATSTTGGNGGGGGTGGVTGSNARFKAKLASATLEAAEDRHDKQFTAMMKYQEEMRDLMGKIARLDMEEIKFQDILELLQNGTVILSKIKKQWAYVVEFAMIISDRATESMVGAVDPFVAMTDVKISAAVNRDILIEQAQEIFVEGATLYMMSKSYVEMSGKYMLVPLAGIARLVTVRTEHELIEEQEKLRINEKEVQRGVKEIIEARKAEYNKKIEANIGKYEAILSVLADESDEYEYDDPYGGDK